MLSLNKYIRELLSKTYMDRSKPIASPMTTSFTLSAHIGDPFDNLTYYSSVVGAFQNITITRHDLTHEVNKVCQFVSKPLVPHWLAVKRILHYLCDIVSYGLVMKPLAQFQLHGFSDVD